MNEMPSGRRFSYSKALDWMLARPVTVIGMVLCATILFAVQIPRLTFSTSVYDLIIEDLPETRNYEAFKSIFGSDEIIRIVVKAEDVFTDETFQFLTLLSDNAAGIKGVRRVISLPTVRKAVDMTGDWTLSRFREVIAPVRLFDRNMISADATETVLTLVLDVDADPAAVIGEVDALMAAHPPALSLYQIGMPLVSQALEQFTRRDFFSLPPVTFFVIAVILMVLYRSWRGLILPLLSVSLCLVWTFGFMAMTGIPLSMLTMIVPVFLIAVGTAYCLHIMSEYEHVRGRSESAVDAVRETFSAISFPTILAISTTIIGLGSLLLNHIPTIREFAVFSCFGMVSLLAVVLTLMPAILAKVPFRQKPDAPRRFTTSLVDRAIELIIHINLNRQRLAFGVIGAFSLFCLVGVFLIRAETNPVGYFRADADVSRNFHDIYQKLSGSFPINIAMGSSEEEYFGTLDHLKEIARLQEYLDKLPGVDKTISFVDYLMLVRYASNGYDPAYYALPTAQWEVRMLLNKFRMMLGEDMYQRFMTETLNRTNITMLTHLTGSTEFIDTRKQILAHVRTDFSKDITWDVTGFGMVISQSSQLLTSGQVKSLSLTMVLVFGIMFLLFLSRIVGAVALVPNLFPILVNFGIMGWLGIELSMFTSLIASIAIGLAVDDTIHYMVRYNREFKKDLDDRRALEETIRQIGRPIIFTTLTISIGFAVLAFSSFKATAIFGLMMVVTMVSALIGDLVLLPSLMLHVELVTIWDLVRLKMGSEPRFGIPLFNGLSRTQVHYILMAGTIRTINAGEVLFRKGDASDSMYTLISGEMAVIDHDKDWEPGRGGGVQKILKCIYKGDTLGEMGLLRGAPRSATIAATTNGELLQINLKMIDRLQWLYPPAARRFFLNLMTILCDRVEQTSHCLMETNLVDDVTGIFNRKGFFSNLETETYRCTRYQSGMSLCLMRLVVEESADCTTHLPTGIGDQTLASFTKILDRQRRRCDFLGRLDHNTFALIMPHTDVADVEILCQRMMGVIPHQWMSAGNGLRIRYGIAGMGPGSPGDCNRLLDLAQEDLEKRPKTFLGRSEG